MLILTESRSIATNQRRKRGHQARLLLLTWLVLFLTVSGCGEPSVRELKNRRELEALLTAISLRSQKELDRDIQRIENRHAAGELSDQSHKDHRQIITKAQGGDWAGAEKQAYEMRKSKPFFQ